MHTVRVVRIKQCDNNNSKREVEECRVFLQIDAIKRGNEYL